MRNALDKGLRSKLEKTVIAAREIAETAVIEVLSRLGVGDATAPDFLDESQRKLRNQLRAHGRQLGDRLDGNSSQQTTHLIAEMAYEHWHRMLFARFLEQNNLLMYDAYTSVTLEDCAELAEEEPDCANAWELAGRLAAKMLPQIFRIDSPVFSVRLAINHVKTLEAMLAELDPETFQAQDSLGWCYQFWQTKRKKNIKESGIKISADEISPVTQFFTEPYMVSFLLDNTIGAWWCNKYLSTEIFETTKQESELRNLSVIPGLKLDFIRFIKNNEYLEIASDCFKTWPEDISELRVLDPCCGSGHFLVALFLMLVPIRKYLDKTTTKEAIEAVIRDNIFGLELDSRCVEIAIFALTLEAWRYPDSGGYRKLPEMQVYCCNGDFEFSDSEIYALEQLDIKLKDNINNIKAAFKDSNILGSLIEVDESLMSSLNYLKEVLQSEVQLVSSEAREKFNSIYKTASILTGKIDLILTNPPYLGERKQNDLLLNYTRKNYKEGSSELATSFLLRCEKLVRTGVQSLVIPQNWLYQTSYNTLRKKLLDERRINLIALLGSKAFDVGVGADVLLLILSNENSMMKVTDLSGFLSSEEKAVQLKNISLADLNPDMISKGEDSRIILEKERSRKSLLKSYSSSYAGILNGDTPRFVSYFWEHELDYELFSFLQSSVSKNEFYSGRSNVVLWENGNGQLRKLAIELKERLHDADRRGNQCWGNRGIVISQMGSIPATLYSGNLFDSNVAVVLPKYDKDLGTIWSFCSSKEYEYEVRQIDKKRNVTNATLVKVPFDYEQWEAKFKISYPHGLPLEYSDDLSQWIFHGHPCASVIWDEQTKWTKEGPVRFDDTVLQVAVARLLGYQWPAELDKDMELAAEQRELVHQAAKLNALADDDGIVCLPAVRGEKPAHIRLESMLIAAYEDDWSADTLHKLLSAVGSKDLETWLRDKFFEQHCKLFQHRPFIWQIWDGLKDGFSVLVNYHKLDYAGLERLIYTYLGDWIRIQEQGTKEGIDGAEARLIAARNLQKTLEAILAGEAPLDLFVRWKSLEEQPIGWNPDLNDGVRLNIRPFMLAPAVGKKDAGILRAKPNINWKKDRGNDVESAPWYTLGLEYGETVGSRINDHHLSLAEKREARETVTKEGS